MISGGWITTVYGTVYLCKHHLSGYPMRFGTDNKVEGKEVEYCEVCSPEKAISRPKKFGPQPQYVNGKWIER